MTMEPNVVRTAIMLGRRAANRLIDYGIVSNQCFMLDSIVYGLSLTPPNNHAIGNVIGLPLLRRWGLIVDGEHVSFRRLPPYLGA